MLQHQLKNIVGNSDPRLVLKEKAATQKKNAPVANANANAQVQAADARVYQATYIVSEATCYLRQHEVSNAQVSKLPMLVNVDYHPSWCIFAGLIFLPLGLPLVWQNIEECNCPSALMNLAEESASGVPKTDDEEVIMFTRCPACSMLHACLAWLLAVAATLNPKP